MPKSIITNTPQQIHSPQPSKFQQLRERAGYSRRRDIAARLAVAVVTVKAWERNRSRPTSDRIPHIADLFGITTREAIDLFRTPCKRCPTGRSAASHGICGACLAQDRAVSPSELREAAGYTQSEAAENWVGQSHPSVFGRSANSGRRTGRRFVS